MKLIPIYTWNKGLLRLNKSTTKLSHQPWAQGVLLLICVILAMLLANLPFTAHIYHSVLSTNLQLHLFSADGSINLLFPQGMTVEKLINDVFMVVFFFTVGLEIRREIVSGELSSPRKAIMPVIAALGGVLTPALIYFLINHGTMAASGWGIPTATDIAFAVCILSVLGNKVPVSLKVFLTALAIVDDLIAILVVAFFYGGSVNLGLLALSTVFIALALVLNRLGEKRIAPYIFCAIMVWILFYYSGIHSTMSGVVMAFLIPSSAQYNKSQFFHKKKKYVERIDNFNAIDEEPFPNGIQRHSLRRLEGVIHGTMSMSYRLERSLSPWVNFLIMPIFAIANAGVTISDPALFNIFRFSPEAGSVSMGIFFGLLLGKPLGITLFSWLAIKLKLGEMPDKASWVMLFAVACLGGIGFTMSIFVDTLSFGELEAGIVGVMRDGGKIAILLGSVASALLGSLLIRLFAKKK